jgi:hypothetical protein
MGRFVKGKWVESEWVELSDDEIIVWQRILRENPIKYENWGRPTPVGYWHFCPICGESLMLLGEQFKPPGTKFYCIDCKTVWFESEQAEDEHLNRCEELFKKEMNNKK